MGKKTKPKKENGIKKVSRKKQGIARWKWLKVLWFKIDELDERTTLIEEFLGGIESMKEVVANRNVYKEGCVPLKETEEDDK